VALGGDGMKLQRYRVHREGQSNKNTLQRFSKADQTRGNATYLLKSIPLMSRAPLLFRAVNGSLSSKWPFSFHKNSKKNRKSIETLREVPRLLQ